MDAVGRTSGRLRGLLPTGRGLPHDSWRSRHLVLYALLVAHIPAIAIYALIMGNSPVHAIFEASIVGAFALGAAVPSIQPRAKAALTTLGLVSSSAVLVHLSNGLIEMHFHFFIVVALVTLYQDWVPFGLAIGYVVLHHGLMGILDVTSVFNHPDALKYPWKWAMFHGLFIAGQSAACLAAWKVNEIGMERERAARKELEKVNRDLGEAQAISNLGSWEWHVADDVVTWSDEMYRIMGVSRDTFEPDFESVMNMLHEDDESRARAAIEASLESGDGFNFEARFVTSEGIKTVEATGRVLRDELGRSIRMAGTVQDVSSRRTLEEQVEYQAFHDTLTGLANRALFLDRVEHALLRRQRHASPVAILFIDLDDFKSVNDSLGHRAGDELLGSVAERLTSGVRSIDTVSRLGGDEFAILLEDLDGNAEATAITERVLHLLREPFEIEGTSMFVGASVGLAFAAPHGAMAPEELLRNADTAMYARKHLGKNGYSVFEQEMQDAATERLAMKHDLQRAIDRQEFVIHYQPIVKLSTGELTGVEALVRWISPERGLVPPLDFIPFAEETGLITPITRLVLVEACFRAVGWQGGGPVRVAVNISAVSFREPSFVAEVADVLASSGLPAELLTLEITESVLVQDDEGVRTRLEELKTLGVKLAIDDFGTGYSSLSYLRTFPTDELKIDKSFIDSISHGPEESALARAIIKLGQTLEMQVVAEGVEDWEQAEFLTVLRCDFAQGYLYSKPLEANQIDDLLRARPRVRYVRPASTESPVGVQIAGSGAKTKA